MEDSIKQQLQSTYDKNALYISKSIMEQWRLDLRENICHTLKEYQVNSILDMGCGSGMDSKFFMDQGFHVKGIDISEKLIQICQRKNVDAIKMDFFDLAYMNEKFDCIYAQNSLLHIPKRDFTHILQLISNVLVDNGIVYIGMFGGINREGVYEKDFLTPKRFFNSYTDESLIELLSQYFEVITFENKPLEKNEFHYQSVFLRKKVKLRKE